MPEDPSYTVLWSKRAIDAIDELRSEPGESGIGKEFARVLRALDEKLRSEPLDVGEVYRSRGVIEEYLAVYEFSGDRLRR
jgi:hypothetical protein